MVAKALGLTMGDVRGPRRPVPSALIVERVCRSLRVDASDLMSRGRHTRVVLARALVTYLARRMTTMSYPEIARCMARPNHSTVITAFNRIKGQMAAGQMVEGGPDLAEVSIQSLAERLEREIASAAG
jgi:chromosomal replication initiation ATPase DnaA